MDLGDSLERVPRCGSDQIIAARLNGLDLGSLSTHGWIALELSCSIWNRATVLVPNLTAG